eukprot:CAMPEP_0182441134 /NCGR_PEP_ID=MMETSP1172-20130603/90_1 /TAXON_ID=708627 /ORGANISM="Timspurckia oligopyrenoides, Strain CCMP3278" /LENGTH=177 /DNA_ID=CAMNT_0024635293 /DNA_START=73 /DNA_END=606 /DNA_ORIENTATION=+
MMEKSRHSFVYEVESSKSGISVVVVQSGESEKVERNLWKDDSKVWEESRKKLAAFAFIHLPESQKVHKKEHERPARRTRVYTVCQDDSSDKHGARIVPKHENWRVSKLSRKTLSLVDHAILLKVNGHYVMAYNVEHGKFGTKKYSSSLRKVPSEVACFVALRNRIQVESSALPRVSV